MKHILRIFTIVLTVLMLCAAVVGCDYRRPGTDDEGGGLQADYEIDFNLPVSTKATISVIIPDNDNERKIINSVIAGFQEKYPNVTVETNFLTIDSYEQTVTKQYSADVLADVIWCNSQNYYFLVSNGYALNLDKFTEDAEAANIFNYEEDFSTEFKGMGLFNDVRYAVPRSIDSVICFYNKEILSAAGVDMSIVQNGWTWEDMLTVCAKVRQYYDGKGQDTYFPLDSNLTWESVAYPVIKSLGGEVLNEDGEFALTEEASEDIVAFVQNLVTKRYIPSSNEQTSSFESGTGALLFQSTSIDNYQTRALLKDKFDVVSFPLINGENSYSGMGFAGYALNSHLKDDADQLNVAAAFLAYLMSYDGQQRVADEGGLTLPSIRADLSVDNPEANWHKKYSSTFNVEAYTWGAQYKTREEFLDNTKAIFTSSLISAMNKYVGSYAVREPNNAYKYFKEEVEYVFDSVVS